MGKGLAVAIVLDAAEKRELTALTRKHGAPQSLAARARIVLAAAGGLDNKAIAAKVGFALRPPGRGAIASPNGALTAFRRRAAANGYWVSVPYSFASSSRM